MESLLFQTLSGFRVLEVVVLSEIVLLAIAGLIAPLLGSYIAFLTLIAALSYTIAASAYTFTLVSKPLRIFEGAFIVDPYTTLILGFAAIVTLLDAIAARRVVEKVGIAEAFYATTALNILGVLSVAYAGSEILVYAAWILAAVSSYVIIGMMKDRIAAEAATKYGIMGAFATALLLYALTINMYVTGSLYIGLGEAADKLYLSVITFLTITSIGFKMGVVPFHAWLPDVYGNARPVLVSIVASSAKVLATLFILRLLIIPAHASPEILAGVSATLAAITMTYGNLAALVAPTPQHLLAYSAIAQAGYLLAGFAGISHLENTEPLIALAGIMLQAIGYAFAKSTIFVALDYYLDNVGSSWGDLRGAYYANRLAGLGFILALITLLGIPPSLGFWGKLYIMYSVIGYSLLLVVIMAVNIAISAYYYMRLAHILLAERKEEQPSDARAYMAFIQGVLSIVLGFIAPLLVGIRAYGY